MCSKAVIVLFAGAMGQASAQAKAPTRGVVAQGGHGHASFFKPAHPAAYAPTKEKGSEPGYPSWAPSQTSSWGSSVSADGLSPEQKAFMERKMADLGRASPAASFEFDLGSQVAPAMASSVSSGKVYEEGMYRSLHPVAHGSFYAKQVNEPMRAQPVSFVSPLSSAPSNSGLSAEQEAFMARKKAETVGARSSSGFWLDEESSSSDSILAVVTFGLFACIGAALVVALSQRGASSVFKESLLTV